MEMSGYQRHPNHPSGFVALNRPNPDERKKVQDLEAQIQQLQEMVKTLVAQVAKEAGVTLIQNEPPVVGDS